MRRKKWKAPNNPTVQARQLWRAVYGEPWPKGWKVKWVGWMRGAMGLCDYSAKTIVLNWGDFCRPKYVEWHDWRTIYVGEGKEISFSTPSKRLSPRSVIETLIHEFTHIRNRGLRHGAEFDRLVRWGYDRLMKEAA